MTEKIIRFIVLSFSVILLAVSVGVIVWISRDESSRLAARERAAIEAAEKALAEERSLKSNHAETGSQDLEKLLHDVDALLISLSSDDLPEED